MLLGTKQIQQEPHGSYWLDSVENKGDKSIFTHRQYTGHIQKSVKKLSAGDGWTDDREMRHMARIPTVLFLKVQDKIAPNGYIDERELRKWLMTEEGAPYRVSNG